MPAVTVPSPSIPDGAHSPAGPDQGLLKYAFFPSSDAASAPRFSCRGHMGRMLLGLHLWLRLALMLRCDGLV